MSNGQLMKKILLVLVLSLLIVSTAFCADNCETITVSDTAIGFTAAKITKPNIEVNFAFCVLAGAQIRFWFDGTSPTATVGQLLEVGQNLTLITRGDIINFKAIRTGAVSGTLSVCYK